MYQPIAQARDGSTRDSLVIPRVVPEATALVSLVGGLTLPLEALQVAWALEARGCTLRVDGESLRVGVGPGSPLTDVEKAKIVQWKLHLIAIVEYVGLTSKPAQAQNRPQKRKVISAITNPR